MKKFLFVWLVMCCLIFAVDSWGAVFQVTNAQEFQHALDAAGSNGENDVIKLDQGMYVGHFKYQQSSYDAGTGNGLSIIGGYTEAGEQSTDPAATVLDGNHGGCTLLLNSFGGIRIMNLTVRNGRHSNEGGGVYINCRPHGDTSPVIFLMNNVIENNQSQKHGGGLFVGAIGKNGIRCHVYLLNNLLRGNISFAQGVNSWGGGGAFLQVRAEGSSGKKPSQIFLVGNTIRANTADSNGGGVHIIASSAPDTRPAAVVWLIGNAIADNELVHGQSGAGVAIKSTAYRFQDVSEAVVLKENTITGNKAQGQGGETNDDNFYGPLGGGAWIESQCEKGPGAPVVLERNVVEDNTAAFGGGLAVQTYASSSGKAGDIRLMVNTVRGNKATVNGGGLYANTVSCSSSSCGAGTILLTNNMVIENISDMNSGGAYVAMSTPAKAGHILVTNNTFADNLAGHHGGGLNVQGVDSSTVIDVYNNILWGNSATNGADITLGCTGVFNGFNNDYAVIEGNWTHQGGNIAGDPLFTGGSDYHITCFSPCKNAATTQAPGLPQTDYDGDHRVIGGAPDMGADELQCFFYPPPWDQLKHFLDRGIWKKWKKETQGK